MSDEMRNEDPCSNEDLKKSCPEDDLLRELRQHLSDDEILKVLSRLTEEKSAESGENDYDTPEKHPVRASVMTEYNEYGGKVQVGEIDVKLKEEGRFVISAKKGLATMSLFDGQNMVAIENFPVGLLAQLARALREINDALGITDNNLSDYAYASSIGMPSGGMSSLRGKSIASGSGSVRVAKGSPMPSNTKYSHLYVNDKTTVPTGLSIGATPVGIDPSLCVNSGS